MWRSLCECVMLTLRSAVLGLLLTVDSPEDPQCDQAHQPLAAKCSNESNHIRQYIKRQEHGARTKDDLYHDA